MNIIEAKACGLITDDEFRSLMHASRWGMPSYRDLVKEHSPKAVLEKKLAERRTKIELYKWPKEVRRGAAQSEFDSFAKSYMLSHPTVKILSILCQFEGQEVRLDYKWDDKAHTARYSGSTTTISTTWDGHGIMDKRGK